VTAPEQQARYNIDQMLELAGWSVQDRDDFDFTLRGASPSGSFL
jgi:hypothetical protein